MVISPPFLPPRGDDESETDWLRRAMKVCVDKACQVETEAGSFPVGGQFMWHTGMHIVAPFDANTALPVRAMADGRVVFVSPPAAYDADAAHPQNYTALVGPLWSDNGCVILRHDTEIGASGTTATAFTFYTLTMHLAKIDPAIKLDAMVYRKDVIGRAGKIYGAQNTVHVEVCCDAAQLEKLTGRPPRWYDIEPARAPEFNGRTDAVYGDLLIYLPATTAVVNEKRNVPATPRNLERGTHTELGKAQWVTIRYEKGQSSITSLNMSGEQIGNAVPGADYEYELYDEACKLHKAYVHGAEPNPSSPSGWYELLRFGRNLGADPLPRNAAHWREIPTVRGTIWADLNSLDTRKYSEADFMAVTGWNFFDDDTDHLDQRCQSVQLKRRIRDPNQYAEGRDTQEHLNERLGNVDVRNKLRRSICYFPTEWDRSTIAARYKWMRSSEGKDKAVNEHKYSAFAAHCRAMTFVDLPEQYINAKWRFHPAEFVETMRRCGWLSTEEFVQCLPRKSLSDANLSWRNAFARANEHGKYINYFLRKYLGVSRKRHIHALSQIYAETGLLSLKEEKGAGRSKRYGPFYGRGYMQLTWPVNYDNYGKFKNIANLVRPHYVDPRIDAKLPFYFDEARKNVVWYPRYDPGLIVSDLIHSADSSGFFWLGKHFRGTKNINKACDLKLTPTTVGFICWLINGGNNAYLERQQFSKYLENVLLDNSSGDMHVSFDYPPLDRVGNPPRDPELSRTFPPTEISYSLKGHVDYARQTR